MLSKQMNPFEFTKAAITAIFDGTGVRSRIQDKIVEGAKALALERSSQGIDI